MRPLSFFEFNKHVPLLSAPLHCTSIVSGTAKSVKEKPAVSGSSKAVLDDRLAVI